MVTPQHLALIEQLASTPGEAWGRSALLACLRRLQDRGPTEAAIVEVYQAWPLEDGFQIVYLSPWGPRVGLTARRGKLEWFANVYVDDPGSEPTPREFGMEVADYFVAEPLGKYAETLEFDSDGLGWWGSER